MKTALTLAALLGLALPRVRAHAAFIHPSTWGFNVSFGDFPYDNRPVAPLTHYTFAQWWFHGHLAHPPNAGDVFELPAGGVTAGEVACHMGATSFWEVAQANGDGGDLRTPANSNDVCPGSGMDEYHTTGPDDLKGCALAITYKDDVNQVEPEDFTVFSVNHTCVFNRFTDFSVPEQMPPCPAGGCICAWFWIHSPDSGGEQNYMNGFRCNVTGSTSAVPLATPQVPRRCGADAAHGAPAATPGNCTWGAKSPFYWFQAERNNMFEGAFAPPEYTALYNFADGAQNDIFADSYDAPLPAPGPNQTEVPAFLKGAVRTSTNAAGKRVDNAAKFLGVRVTTVTATATVVASSAAASSSAIASVASTLASALSSASAGGAMGASGTASAAPQSASVVPTTSTVRRTSSTVVQTTSTVLHTVVVTATSVVYASPTGAPASSPSGTLSATNAVSSSTATSATSVASAPSSALAGIQSVYTSVYAPSTLKLVAAATSSSGAAPPARTAAQLAAAGSGGCRAARGLERSAVGVQRRALGSFHATGSFKRRRLTDRASLWRIF